MGENAQKLEKLEILDFQLQTLEKAQKLGKIRILENMYVMEIEVEMLEIAPKLE